VGFSEHPQTKHVLQRKGKQIKGKKDKKGNTEETHPSTTPQAEAGLHAVL